MQGTELWLDWHIHHVATHSDGSRAKRIEIFLRAVPGLLRALLSRPALVHIHMSSYGSFFRKSIVVWLAALLRVPVVLHVHGGEFHKFYSAAPVVMRAFIRRTLESAVVVVALGATWRQRLQRVAPKAKVVIVPNAVRLAHPVAQPSPGEPVRMLFLGRVADSKGTFDLLDAWAAAFGGNDQAARLTIAGDGEIDRARKRVTALGLGACVEILGWMPAPQVDDLLGSSHVLVLPSYNEGQPMAILEAMAHGLCVLATDVGGIPDLVDDRCGILIRPGDAAALAAGLTRVATASAERRAIAEASWHRARDEFDATVVSRRLDTIYREILS